GVFRQILQDMARAQFPLAYVRASGDLTTVRDGYTRVIKTLGHRSLRPFLTSSEWVDRALLQERFTAGLATFAAGMTVLLACMGGCGLVACSPAGPGWGNGVGVGACARRGGRVLVILAGRPAG